MSVVVLFEAEFVPGGRERYLALAQKLAERARFSVSVDVSQYVLFGFLAAGAFGAVAGGGGRAAAMRETTQTIVSALVRTLR